MNFLAHLFLSCQEEELLIGNFMGDFVRGSQLDQYPESIQAGIHLHRKIDTFTDAHPVVREGARLLRPEHSRYAPVILDVFYDFLLIKNWFRFSEESLREFTQNVYTTLERNIEKMPPALQRRVPHMIADDWLMRYGEWDGLAFAFSRMRLRVSRPAYFDQVIDSLQQHEAALDAGFQQFFPDVIAFVECEC
jgi:acyl carrier protein phosphodiesterase